MAKRKKQNPPPKVQARQQSRQAALAEAERLKAQQAAKDRRRKLIGVGIGLGVIVAAVVVVILVLQATGGKDYSTLERPSGANEAGSVVIGQDLKPGGEPASGDDVVVMRIYSDYMCPGCAGVERRLGTRLEELAESGDIKLEIQPVSFLDRLSQGTEYSTRAANAAATVARYAPDQFLAFHSKLFEKDVQPAENSEGLTDEKLAELAQGLGVPQDVTERFAAREFADWVDYSTTQAQNQPVKTTPSIWVGSSDSDLELLKDPGSFDIDQMLAKVRDGKDPN
ncbi:MAG: thioredoxin domain-containing protein [Bifidobacteriaceae bacterium]|jgi:protein-disulfide isomerase|nr:thioredoxin domain-containing protein [Bifidobacteriaceae bacterium]